MDMTEGYELQNIFTTHKTAFLNDLSIVDYTSYYDNFFSVIIVVKI